MSKSNIIDKNILNFLVILIDMFGQILVFAFLHMDILDIFIRYEMSHNFTFLKLLQNISILKDE